MDIDAQSTCQQVSPMLTLNPGHPLINYVTLFKVPIGLAQFYDLLHDISWRRGEAAAVPHHYDTQSEDIKAWATPSAPAARLQRAAHFRLPDRERVSECV